MEGYIEFALTSLMNLSHVRWTSIIPIAKLGLIKRSVCLTSGSHSLLRGVYLPPFRVVAALEEKKCTKGPRVNLKVRVHLQRDQDRLEGSPAI